VIINSYNQEDFLLGLKKRQVSFQAGPFSVRVSSCLDSVVEGIQLFYKDYPSANPEFADFHINILPPKGIRRWLRPQVNFDLDGIKPFKPMPMAQAFATFEWGFNYCTSSYSHQYLIVHAAVVEKNGYAVIMPAQPGSGKSTLCAGLVSRGWRLLSDELTLIPVDNPNVVTPITRPINLKNTSIDVMKEFAPDETFGPIVLDTAKGTVAHMRAPVSSIRRIDEPARQRLIIFPKYQRGSETILQPRGKARAFMEIAQQSFNFNILAKTGFDILKNTVTQCDCYDFKYSRLEEAIALFNKLIEQQPEISLSSDIAEATL
jgi:HprK-related kinase A